MVVRPHLGDFFLRTLRRSRVPLGLRWIILSAIVAVSPSAFGAIPLCLRVVDATGPGSGLEQLARSEIAKHPSHTLASEHCASRLIIDLFMTGTVRYLSVGIEGEVPTRHAIESDKDIERHLSEAIALSLGNDPEHLMATVEGSGLDRMRVSILERGMNSYRVEAFETMARTDTGTVFTPGLAFAAHRGSEHWQVYARAYFGYSPSHVANSDRVLRLSSGVDLGMAYEFSRRSMTTPYVGAGAGIGFLRFEGLTNPSDRASVDRAEKLGALTTVRIGIRTLRFFDFDADIFAAGYLPLFKTHRVDSDLFGENGTYTPFVQLGVGVGF